MPHATQRSQLVVEPLVHDPKQTKVDFGATVTGVDLNDLDGEYPVHGLSWHGVARGKWLLLERQLTRSASPHSRDVRSHQGSCSHSQASHLQGKHYPPHPTSMPSRHHALTPSPAPSPEPSLPPPFQPTQIRPNVLPRIHKLFSRSRSKLRQTTRKRRSDDPWYSSMSSSGLWCSSTRTLWITR